MWTELIAVNSKNYKRHINELVVQNTELFNAATSGTCTKCYSFESLNKVTWWVTLAFYRHNLCQHTFHKLDTAILPSQSLQCCTISPAAFANTLSIISTHTHIQIFYTVIYTITTKHFWTFFTNGCTVNKFAFAQ